MNIGPKRIPLPGRGTLARRSEYPVEDAKAVVSGDADDLKASKTTSLCLCLNSADNSGDRNQSSIVPREELKTAQEVTPGWAPASFFPTPNPCGSLARNGPADPPQQLAELWAPAPLMSRFLCWFRAAVLIIKAINKPDPCDSEARAWAC